MTSSDRRRPARPAGARGPAPARRAARLPGLALGPLCLLLAACRRGDAVGAARMLFTGDVAGAQCMAAEKAVRYAVNPQALAWDLKAFRDRLEGFRKAVDGIWGEKDREEPGPRRYVKYSGEYRSRAMVDFDTGVVTVETVDQRAPLASLEAAVTATVLAPADPRAVDLYSASEITLGEEPFLYGQVKDFQGQDIRWEWRARQFARELVARGTATRTVRGGAGPQLAHAVRFELVPGHLHLRAARYAALVREQARRFAVSENLIYAIMKTESDFNPFAVSSAPAFGLMQIVPGTAGADVTRMLTGSKGQPSKEFLFEPANNVLYGTAYLHILDTRHLAAVTDPVAREYCVIAAYNGGSGAVLRSFDADRAKAAARINALGPARVYEHLRSRLPAQETRRYLAKVMEAKKLFVGVGARG
ncbi:murein transglycosylase domain-containing protein [Desulfocurvus sp.]|uniref:murein transglycosylase domain-containing protein n=1 Tax=Desulfocurvus sp. TaxID=2871698 RepID=UPI0025BE53F6|nr:murein transglycosylase domain-containing protein [Desulfocurvus sp.]MCK9240242.1 murein transglycosylase domain-containing protein [Desulfocurvus sp.]